ncbi:hypothetical protein HN358_04045 [Candidatus Uhrbacteria bacterium]|jgi:hypothetical protein|nr:hypothetical protein [Candidatus Uhrbacteria bacterium]MBT7716950.1 hypothetical protein [Candidatus Uhrbacteria bacterium]
MKKLIALLVISLFALPAPSVQALVMLSDPDETQLIENVMNAESYDFNVDIDFETSNDDIDNPITLHVDYDAAWTGDEAGLFDLGVNFSNQYGDYSAYDASLISTPDDSYVSDDGEQWYFLGESLISDSPTQQEIGEAITMTEGFLTELIDNDVITYAPEMADFINGQFTVRYAYELDGDKLTDYLILKGMVLDADQEKTREYLTNDISVSGNVWIDTVNTLPVMITLNVDTGSSDASYTTLRFSVLFNSFNEQVIVEVPENVTDINEYDSTEIEDFVMSSFESAVTNMDTDGDGLSNDQEMLTWNTDVLSSDTDGDGYDDYTEVVNGYNPNGSGILDTDGDGLTDYAEMTIHWSDPYDIDSDNDGYNDGVEIANGYDPNGLGRW